MSLGNRPRHSSFAVSRTLVGGNRDRGDPSWKHKDKKESPPVPDSTTEPAPRPAQKFQEGDEVFYQTDTGQQMLGTVGEVRGLTCLVQFGDGTEQLAPFKRLKKLFEDVKEEETKPKRKKSELTPPTQSRPQQTCGSCGVSRRISAKKAKLYEDELRQFECRRCVKQSQSPNSPGAAIGPLFNSASNSLKGKLPSDVSIIPMSIAAMGSQGPVFSLPSTSSPHALKSKSPSLNAPVSIPRQIQFSVLPGRKPSGCFNCENSVQPCDRVHCNMCERPCHLMCLSICPPPLSGDRFWDLLCSSCGNQNKDEIVKVFSVRRNINSWADIACLLISCLSVKFGLQRMFDFESEMLPFLETNMDRLHLPRMYKTPPAEARKKFILNALTTSRLRFQNGRELKKRTTLWGLRTDQYDSKKLVNSIAWDSGLKPTSRSEVPTSPPPLISPIGDGSISTLIPTVNLPVIIQKESPPLSYPENSPEVSDLVPLNSLKKSQSMFNIRENVSDTASDTDSSQASNTDRDAKLKKEPENKPIPTKGAKGLTSRNPSMIARVFQNWGGGGRKKSISESSVHGSRIAPLRLERRTFEESKTSSLSPATLKMIKKDTLNKRKIAEVSNSQKTKQTSDESDRKRKIEEGSRSTQPNAKEPATKRLKSEILNNTSTKPVRRDCEESIQDVNKVTPPRKTFLPSPHSTSDESDDDLPLEVLKQNYDLLSPIQRAIKTASSIPPPAPQLKKNIESVSEIKPKLGRGRPKKENDSSSPIGNRLRAKKRGRPTTNSKSPIKSSINGATNPKSSAPKQVNVVNPKSGNTNANTVPIVSRRVGTFNSISERRPMPTVVPDPSLNPLNAISSALFDSAVYGNYRMECLPKSPQTDSERKNEALKVFSHFRTEKENEIAAFLLSRSLTETRSQTRRKSELFVGTQKRDLNDFDSYEVIGKRVDPDGITRYQVLWKRQDDPFSDYDDFEPEEEEFKQDKIEMESSLVKNGFRPFAPLQLLMGSSSENIGVKSVGNFPVMAGIDESSQFEPPEVLRSSSSSSSSLIDLTDSP